ncbi:MAG: hypothetical protein HQL94_08180 [Magnetococcales bacterium]|nr:hypothetical protein [Magnetococcales bacterium]MBF0439099.1 hypothetical protein [Magnetococcales bacterium]
MKILNLHDISLSTYCRTQITRCFPSGNDTELELIDRHLDAALYRLEQCIASIRTWAPGEFDVLHSSQYCTFLYYLSNTIWQAEQAKGVCTRLFLLNKALNSIDIFYEIEMPDIFFIGHSIGVVFAKAHYSNYLVIYQNSTVGKNHGIAPVLESGVVLYPNAAIIGNCRIRQGSIIAQGVRVINQETLAHRIAFQGPNGSLIFKKHQRPILADFFKNLPPELAGDHCGVGE